MSAILVALGKMAAVFLEVFAIAFDVLHHAVFPCQLVVVWKVADDPYYMEEMHIPVLYECVCVTVCVCVCVCVCVWTLTDRQTVESQSPPQKSIGLCIHYTYLDKRVLLSESRDWSLLLTSKNSSPRLQKRGCVAF